MRQSAHRGAPPLWEHRFGNPFVIACTTGRTLRPKRNVAISNKENPNYDDVRSANLCLGNNSDLPVRGHAAPGINPLAFVQHQTGGLQGYAGGISPYGTIHPQQQLALLSAQNPLLAAALHAQL